MRWLVFLFAATLSACSRSADTFQIYDPENMLRSADVQLCGLIEPLKQDHKLFVGSVPILCEGSGIVVLVAKNNRRFSCHIGYVTDLHQSWKFTVNGNKCVPLPNG
jgi:hypothetical protein